jgi:cellulose synthase/poly-beta-1,6-N-acetylglucosamine synthase-like glycosyltransferase/putative flippase GtrA
MSELVGDFGPIHPQAVGARLLHLPRPVRFVVVGGSCFVVQLAILAALVRVGLERTAADAAAFAVSAQLNFVLSSLVTWGDRPALRPGRVAGRLLAYNGTALVSLGVNTAVFALASIVMGVVPAAVLGVLTATVFTYVICNRLVFRPRGAAAPSPSAAVPGESVAVPAESVAMAAESVAVPAPSWVVPAGESFRALVPVGSAKSLAARRRLPVPVKSATGTELELFGGEPWSAERIAPPLPLLRRPIVVRQAFGLWNHGLISEQELEAVTRRGFAEDDPVPADRALPIPGADASRVARALRNGTVTAGQAGRWLLDKGYPGDRVAAFVHGYSVMTVQVAVARLWRAVAAMRIELGVASALLTSLGFDPRTRDRYLTRWMWQLRPAGVSLGVPRLGVAGLGGPGLGVPVPALAADVGPDTGRRDGGADTRRRDRAVANGSSKPALAVVPDSTATGPTHVGGLPVTPPDEPPGVLSRGQKVFLVLSLVVLAAAAVVFPFPTVIAINAVLLVVFMGANFLKLALIRRSMADPTGSIVSAAPDAVADEDLPVYTILLPVYHESEVLEQLMAGIARIDYPHDRLDVKLLLEEDDEETRRAVETIDLPDWVDVLLVPDDGPRGKPRACNVGLRRAKGDFLVIYDAEDRPEPDQLRRSVAAFATVPDEVVCLQAKLNYFNRAHNVLTRWFTAEYSMWFDQLLPGLQSMDAAIPLGGTSNHFVTARLRELGGWNAYNVTEDADLGMRIFLRGWKTRVLDSTTFEEATSRTYNWTRQRSRWVKGYMQTYLYFMRHPFRLWRSMGWRPFAAFQLFVGAGTLCLLINPIYWMLTIAWYFTHAAGIQSVFPWPVLYLATIGLFVGNAAFTLAMVNGCFWRRNYEDVKWAFLTPLYWIMMSIGAWKALIQLCYKPSYWEKTVHGYCPYDATDVERARSTDPEPVPATAG